MEGKLQELGLTPLDSDEFSPLSENDVEQIEELVGGRLPDDYRWFLLNYGASDFDQYAVFPTAGGGIAPGTFFGQDITAVLTECSDRMPQQVVPINDDGAGNLLCISLRPDSFGAILYQSHSVGWSDASDEDMAKLSTLVPVAADFVSFIDGLEAED